MEYKELKESKTIKHDVGLTSFSHLFFERQDDTFKLVGYNSLSNTYKNFQIPFTTCHVEGKHTISKIYMSGDVLVLNGFFSLDHLGKEYLMKPKRR